MLRNVERRIDTLHGERLRVVAASPTSSTASSGGLATPGSSSPSGLSPAAGRAGLLAESARHHHPSLIRRGSSVNHGVRSLGGSFGGSLPGSPRGGVSAGCLSRRGSGASCGVGGVDVEGGPQLFISCPATPHASGVYYRMAEECRSLSAWATLPSPAPQQGGMGREGSMYASLNISGVQRVGSIFRGGGGAASAAAPPLVQNVLYSTSIGTWMIAVGVLCEGGGDSGVSSTPLLLAMKRDQGSVQSRRHGLRPPTHPDLVWRRFEQPGGWVGDRGQMLVGDDLDDMTDALKYPSAIAMSLPPEGVLAGGAGGGSAAVFLGGESDSLSVSSDGAADRRQSYRFERTEASARNPHNMLPVWSLGHGTIHATDGLRWRITPPANGPASFPPLVSSVHSFRPPTDPSLDWYVLHDLCGAPDLAEWVRANDVVLIPASRQK